MRLVDSRARSNISRYFQQCLMATITILALLLLLNVDEHSIMIATLGASSFVVFSMLKTYAAADRRLIGGYLVSIHHYMVFGSKFLPRSCPFE